FDHKVLLRENLHGRTKQTCSVKRRFEIFYAVPFTLEHKNSAQRKRPWLSWSCCTPSSEVEMQSELNNPVRKRCWHDGSEARVTQAFARIRGAKASRGISIWLCKLSMIWQIEKI